MEINHLENDLCTQEIENIFEAHFLVIIKVIICIKALKDSMNTLD